MNRYHLKQLYHTFYRPDWPWHLLIVTIVAGILFLYAWLPQAIEQLVNLALAGTDISGLLPPAINLALIFIGLAGLATLRQALLAYALVTRILNRVQTTLLERLLAAPLDFFETHTPGELRDVMINIANTAASGMMNLVTPLFTLVQGLFLLLVMALVNLPLTLIAVAVLAAYTFFITFFQRPVSDYMEQRNRAERVMSAAVDDLYHGFPEIKRNGLETAMLSYLDEKTAPYFTATLRFFRRIIALGFVADFVGNLLPAVLLVATALPLVVGAVTPATFVTIYTLSILLVGLLKSLHAMNRSAIMGLTSWRHVLELLQIEPERSEGIVPAGSKIVWQQVDKRLRDKPVLNDVTLCIEPGEKVMIVGRSGEGKTTILKMLPGLLTADTGSVQVGDVETAVANPVSLRARVGFVTQSPYLFESSLRHNLTYGLTVDEAALTAVLQLVQLDELLAELPDGLDTYLGPDGHTVSGGEKARIALARAILRRPEILILDEATANLDSETEERIYAHLLRLDCTVVGVTHRLSTLSLFPRIIALAGGKIVLDGPTERVITTPHFHELFAFQMEN